MAIKSLVARGWQGVAKYLQALEPTLITLTGTQTLTNKTLTSPVITGGTSTAKDIVTAVTADGAIAIATGTVSINKTSAAAMTLAAPTAAQAGTIITITSTTAYAHVVTFTGSTLLDGTATPKITATLAAHAGSTVQIVANNLKWNLISNTAATLA